MKKYLLALLALAFAMNSASAQEQTLKTTLVTYAPGEMPKDFVAFFKTGPEILPFAANAGILGEPVRYEGPRRFVLRATKEEFEAGAESQKPPLAFVDLPENADNILILAAAAGEGKIRLIAYDIASGNLKPGSYKIFNFSSSMLSVILGPQKFTLAPAKDILINDPAFTTEVKAFPLQIATVANNKATLVKNTFWEHWPQKRYMMFMFDGRRKGEPIGFMSFNVEPPLRPKNPEGQP